MATRSMLAEKNGGISAGAAAMVRLLETDHLNDQLAALAWLRRQGFVRYIGRRKEKSVSSDRPRLLCIYSDRLKAENIPANSEFAVGT